MMSTDMVRYYQVTWEYSSPMVLDGLKMFEIYAEAKEWAESFWPKHGGSAVVGMELSMVETTVMKTWRGEDV